MEKAELISYAKQFYDEQELERLSRAIDFAINRSRNSYIAELLEKREIRVFNNSMVTDIANNKGKNYKYLELYLL